MALSNENGSNGMVMPVVPYGNNSGSGWGNGYSMHSYKDRIIANLENKMQTAPTEADKAFIEGLLGFAEGRV